MGIKWICIKDSSFEVQLERQIQHNLLNNINSLIMVKCWLYRQNTKSLKGYKMNPDTTPAIFRPLINSFHVIKNSTQAAPKFVQTRFEYYFYLNRLI
jgi:hypothetical protein